MKNSDKSNKISIIIPCYNEENNISDLLTELYNYSTSYDNIVINDCSTDNTNLIAQNTGKATVISLPINLGVGGAVQTGFIFSQKQKSEYVIKIDGDGQHNPSYINDLLEPLYTGKADIVIGSRFLKSNSGFKSTFFRRLGIKLLQISCKLLTGLNITDPTSGFRAYNKKALDFMAENYPNFDYPEPEEIILAYKNNLKIVEVPIEMRARQGGKSSISSVGSVYYMIKVILAMLFIKLR